MTIYNAFWVLITNDRIFHNLLMLVVRLVSILVNITRPTEACSFFFKTDKVFVFYEYILFNLSLASPPFIYCKLPLLSI